MIQVYAKLDNYRFTEAFDTPTPKDFAEVSAALKRLYPEATVHFVEDRNPKWSFIVGEMNKIPQPKAQGKKKKV